MGQVYSYKELAEYINETQSMTEAAKLKALIAVTLEAERLAKKNAKKNFTGRNDRKLSGSLINSIYSGVETDNPNKDVLQGFVGTKGIPYGAIHEYGGTIVPVKAKHLWVPKYANAGKMTPKEFIRLTQNNPKFYHLFNRVASRWTGGYKYTNDRGRKIKKKLWEPLFFLMDKVTIPQRAYITPALEIAVDKFGTYFSRFLGEEQ